MKYALTKRGTLSYSWKKEDANPAYAGMNGSRHSPRRKHNPPYTVSLKKRGGELAKQYPRNKKKGSSGSWDPAM